MKRVALSRRLLLLVATGLLPVVVMSALGLYGLYAEQRRQTERTASELARALSTALDTELQQSIAALEVLAASPRLDRPELEPFRVQLERVVAMHPNWREVMLLDRAGNVLLYADTESAPPLHRVVERDSLE